MFANACASNREAIYGLLASSPLKQPQMAVSAGSAFMIAPGLLVTAAHGVHLDSIPSRPVHQKFEVIRAPDVGQRMEVATFVAKDPVKDLALLRIDKPRSSSCLGLLKTAVLRGTACGSLGFPLAQVAPASQGLNFNLVERFQGAYVSALVTSADQQGNSLTFYETDSLMYRGSSGCPGFVKSGEVFGMQSHSLVEQQGQGTSPAGAQTRLAISRWVTSMDIVAFAFANGITP
ncbi:MAG TPA: serine protease [Planctomycetota bacterium]|jgi:S1-C subfamily serine protease|nr:serine protease [Planctomycetota bacterium]